jgi:esterase/lipase
MKLTGGFLRDLQAFFYAKAECRLYLLFFEGNEIGVLVSHGFTGTTQSMRYLGESLAGEGGFTVIGPRLKGHGTDPADMATSTAEEWIRGLEAALAELQPRCKKIFITGLSMGGILTLSTRHHLVDAGYTIATGLRRGCSGFLLPLMHFVLNLWSR